MSTAADWFVRTLDRPALTTDIIVGFPGETEDDFLATCQVAEEVGFSKIHIFPFSARRGTPAAEMADQVHPAVKADRAARLAAPRAGDCASAISASWSGAGCESSSNRPIRHTPAGWPAPRAAMHRSICPPAQPLDGQSTDRTAGRPGRSPGPRPIIWKPSGRQQPAPLATGCIS